MFSYVTAEIPETTEVWVMPQGATLEQQELSAKEICNKAMALGYNVAPRVHVYVYGNAVNT